MALAVTASDLSGFQLVRVRHTESLFRSDARAKKAKVSN